MRVDPFTGPALKIFRARQHIAILEEEISHFLHSAPSQLPDPEWDGQGTFYWHFPAPPQAPLEWSLLIGDSVHNMRSALDICICDALRTIGRNPRNASFPFAQNKEKLDEALLRDPIRHLGRDILQIISECRPFTGGNVHLRAISDLDNDDKHNMIIPVTTMISSQGFRVTSGQHKIKFEAGATFIANNRNMDAILKYKSDQPFIISGDTKLFASISVNARGEVIKPDLCKFLREAAAIVESVCERMKLSAKAIQ